MKKNIKIFVISLLFLCGITLGKAQVKFSLKKQLKIEFLETTLNTADTSITIKYNLKGSKKRYYNTRLYYSNNGGNSFKGPLRSVQGDLGDSAKVGKYKVVDWSFRRDNPYFDGKNIMFKIEATEVPKIANGGPVYALHSLLIPGFGDTKVRNGYNYGWIGVATYATLATGGLLYLQSEKQYDDYQDRIANTEVAHVDLLNKARRTQDLAQGFLIAGATIWAADIIGVYIRGMKNKRRLAKARREAEEKEKEDAFLILPAYRRTLGGDIGQLTLLWRF